MSHLPLLDKLGGSGLNWGFRVGHIRIFAHHGTGKASGTQHPHGEWIGDVRGMSFLQY